MIAKKSANAAWNAQEDSGEYKSVTIIRNNYINGRLQQQEETRVWGIIFNIILFAVADLNPLAELSYSLTQI